MSALINNRCRVMSIRCVLSAAFAVWLISTAEAAERGNLVSLERRFHAKDIF
jgi:hypothetical protein